MGKIKELGIVIVFIAILVILMILSPYFARPANLITIIKQASINGILAMGMMFVIISGEIDLSVGSIVALTGVVSASFAHPDQYPLIVPVVLSLSIGLLAGMLNGLGVAYGNVPSFIVTLGMMTIIRGAALIISGGAPVFGVTEAYEHIAGGFILGKIPLLVLYFTLISAVSAAVLSFTVFGRRVYAVGGNEVSAAFSGISVRKIRLSVFMISGLLAGFAGLLLASRTVSGNPTAGQSYELDAIAAVIIGGVSMSGGSGRWFGPVVGALLIAVLGNGLDILNVSSHYQLVIKGAIIIFAVLLDVNGKNRTK